MLNGVWIFVTSTTLTYFGQAKKPRSSVNLHVLFQGIGVQVLSVADYQTLTLLHDKAVFYADLRPDVAKIMDYISVNNRHEFDCCGGKIIGKI